MPLRRILVLFAIALCAALYLANITGMGMVSVDEPRYAAIGRAMASSGDWITPRLWGSPWFEKPVLLYWLVALGFKLGLGPDLAPRLPIALLSLGFLTFFWYRLRALWDTRIASYATAILATSTGWLAYSHIAITDIPLAVALWTAILLALSEDRTSRTASLIAAALGIAVLAKSLVALILFAPVLLLSGRWRYLLRPLPILVFLGIALPWHILCALQNGPTFFRVLFLEHQFGRYTSTAMQHPQPFWFYIPVLLMFLFPWFPLLAVAPRDLRDSKLQTLWVFAVFGFLFLSSGINKLPHYVLPLTPALAILMALGLSRASQATRVLILPLTLLGLLPLAAGVAPNALANGLSSTAIPWLQAAWVVAALVIGIVLNSRFPRFAAPVAFSLAGLAFLWFQFSVFPAIDQSASARPLWLREHPVCSPTLQRSQIYGLSYYSEKAVPGCQILDLQRDSIVR